MLDAVFLFVFQWNCSIKYLIRNISRGKCWLCVWSGWAPLSLCLASCSIPRSPLHSSLNHSVSRRLLPGEPLYSLPRTSRPPNTRCKFCVVHLVHFLSKERYYNFNPLPPENTMLSQSQWWLMILSWWKKFHLMKFMFLLCPFLPCQQRVITRTAISGSGYWNRICPYFCFVATWRALSRLKRQRRMRIQVLYPLF